MKILVVGYGSIGKRHVKNLLENSDSEIIICTKNKNLEKFDMNRVKIVKSLKKAMNENITCALITNNTSEHVETATKLINKNIDIFIEKPLSNSIEGISNLLKLVKKKKIITLMACNLRFHPCIEKIKKMINSNEIGKIISVQVENGSYLPDWHQNEDYSKSYVAKQKLGGGIILTSIHELDYLYWLFGDVKEVFAVSEKMSELKIETNDIALMILKFKKNILAEVHLDYLQRPYFRSCKIKGTKGVIYWDSDSNSVKVFNTNTKKWSKKMHVKKYEHNLEYVKEINHFIHSVKNNKKTINNLEDGIDTLKIALAAIRSSKTKKLIKIR